MRIRTAVQDRRLSARIVERRPLFYRDGPSGTQDRPAHVRAASGLAWSRGHLAVIQDDTSFLALVDPSGGDAIGLPLPHAPGGHRQFDDLRGNKADKLDLEVLFAPDPELLFPADPALLVGLGSGSTPARRSALVVWSASCRIAPAHGLYLALEQLAELSGSELNLEGAAPLADGRLRLFQRGNGDPTRARPPVDATLDVDLVELLAYLTTGGPCPAIRPAAVTQYALGALAGARLTFTDAALDPARGRLCYLACAERSPDAVRDGEVVGSALGVFDEIDGDGELRFAPLTDAGGAPLAVKAEGLAFGPDGGAYVVLDADDPARPSDLCRVELAGPWA